MKTRKEQVPSRSKRRSVMGAIAAAAALVMSALVPTAAHAAPPEAGTYEGTSTAYTDAPFSFEIDSSGRITNLNSISYCTDGFNPPQPVYWAGDAPAVPIEAGQSFSFEWDVTDGGFGTYYELSGTVNADGTASGAGRAGFLPSGTCGGMNFEWTASLGDGGGGDPEPQDPTVVLEKSGYYDYEIQRVGIMIRGEGFPADTDVEIAIHRVSNDEEQYSTVVRSDANGVVYDRYVGWLAHQPLPVPHRVTLTAEADGEEFTDEETFSANPGGDGSFQYFHARDMTVAPQSVSQSELATEGVRIESDDMDGREDTAELLIDGKHVGDVPVVEIADQFGEVAHDYIDDSLPPGEHEAALRTVHVSGSLNPVTWERVAWETFTVTEDPVVYDPTASVNRDSVTESELAGDGVVISGQDFPPSTDVDLLINGSVVDTGTSLYNGQVVFPYTSGTLGTGTHDVQLQGGGYTADTSFTVTADPVEYEPTASVSPTELTVSELADPGVVASGEGFAPGSTVTFSVAGSEITTDDADAQGEVSFPYTSDSLGAGSHQVELSSADGADTTSFTVVADEDPDPIEVTAEAPTRDGNTVTIPTVTGVIYVDDEGTELSGDVTLEEGQTLTVAATADDGYVLADGTHEWTFTYEDEDPEPTEVTAEAPTQDGNTVTIPVVEGVTYTDDEGTELSGDVTLEEGQTLTVAATADDGYVLADGTHEWTFTYEDEDPEPIEVTAEAPTQDGNTVTIPVVEGVTYTDDEGTELSGDVTLEEGQTLTVAATADDGYVLADGTHEWVFEYEDADQGTIPSTAPTEDDLDPALEGEIEVPAEAEPGDEITVTADGVEPGTEIGVWLFSDPVYLGTHTVNEAGQVTVTIPADTELGAHHVGVWSADGLVGWDAIDIVSADNGGGDDNGNGGDDGNGGGDDGRGDGGSDGDGTDDDIAATGSEGLMTAAALGALLLFGSAALLLRRRGAME